MSKLWGKNLVCLALPFYLVTKLLRHVKTWTTCFFQHYSADDYKFLYTASCPKIRKKLLCFAVVVIAAKMRCLCCVNRVVFLWCQGIVVFFVSGEVLDVSLEGVCFCVGVSCWCMTMKVRCFKTSSRYVPLCLCGVGISVVHHCNEFMMSFVLCFGECPTVRLLGVLPSRCSRDGTPRTSLTLVLWVTEYCCSVFWVPDYWLFTNHGWLLRFSLRLDPICPHMHPVLLEWVVSLPVQRDLAPPAITLA